MNLTKIPASKRNYITLFLTLVLILGHLISLRISANAIYIEDYVVEDLELKTPEQENNINNMGYQPKEELFLLNNSWSFTEEEIVKYLKRKAEEEQAIIEAKEKELAEIKAQEEHFDNYNNSPESKWLTIEQFYAIKDTGFTPTDLRIMSTVVFWEVGKIRGNVSICYPEISWNYYQVDAYQLRYLVGSVLMNRTLYHDYFPDTIYENVVMKGQYYPGYTEEYGTYSTNTAYTQFYSYWEDVVNTCIDIMIQDPEHKIPEGVIFQSNYSSLGNKYYAIVQVPKGMGSTCYFAY